jgi:hypothetical protein
MKFYNTPIARLLAYILVATLAVIGVAVINRHTTSRTDRIALHSIQRDEAAATRTCQRVQYLRDQANSYGFLIYDVFKQSAEREKSLIKGDPANAAAHRKSAKNLLNVANSTLVTGPTDCTQAVNNPNGYKAPSPQLVARDGPQIKILRARVHALRIKAKKNEPLFQGTILPGDPKP